MPASTESFYCPAALTLEGWREHVVIEATEGTISRVACDLTPAPDSHRLSGPVVPGMCNVHSHAFQRAMAGLAERRESPGDNFWVWREAMYRFASALDPDDVEAIARLLYIDLLKGGFTSVGEFHYLHHAPEGVPYDDLAEMSRRILAAAQATGIRLTHLPALYSRGGFDGRPLAGAQTRFANDVGSLLDIRAAIAPTCADSDLLSLGMAFHSLRAVSANQIAATLDALPPGRKVPIHIHVAEQTQEVEDCVAALGARPVQWLLNNVEVNDRWCLIHATHIDGRERRSIVASQAVVGLCPTTEANLGDGVFPAGAFLAEGGRISVGTDSHVGTLVAEELRLLEYGQRLTHRQRNLLAPPGLSVGASLYAQAAANGAAAIGHKAGVIAPGYACDLVILRGSHPLLAGRSEDSVLDTFVFAGDHRLVRDVIVGGRLVVQDGHHTDEVSAAELWTARIGRLASRS